MAKHLYEVVGGPHRPEPPTQWMMPSVVHVGGELVGILSDPSGSALSRTVHTEELALLHHVDSITKALGDVSIRNLSSFTRADLDDIAPEAVFARDLDVHHVVLVRARGTDKPWPGLRTLHTPS